MTVCKEQRLLIGPIYHEDTMLLHCPLQHICCAGIDLGMALRRDA